MSVSFILLPGSELIEDGPLGVAGEMTSMNATAIVDGKPIRGSCWLVDVHRIVRKPGHARIIGWFSWCPGVIQAAAGGE